MPDRTHWTFHYMRSRLAVILYQRSKPEEPWLTRSANLALSSLLKPTDIGLEFGSGRSTLWFAAHMQHLTSVEHNHSWHSRVTEMMRAGGIRNVTYLSREASDDEADGDTDPYVAVTRTFADQSLDFVLIDGAQRALCALAVLPKLRPGAMLVIDNVNWFLPSASVSPNSRSLDDGAREGVWRAVHAAIAPWRVMWTSNSVWDTAIFFKPCGSNGAGG
jgi:hypothetical protein